MTQQNYSPTAPQSTNPAPLVPAATAKRLAGLLGASTGPVLWHGVPVLAVQRKRHPYDAWHGPLKAGNIDTQNPALKYRLVLQYPSANGGAATELV